MSRIRCFIALALPDDLRQALAGLQGEFAAPQRDLRLSLPRADSLHLTLAFLGDVDEAIIPALHEALCPAIAAHEPFSLVLRGCGGFPDLARPRVIWAGVERHPRLLALHADLATALRSAGLAPDSRPYAPHLTLARVKQSPPGLLAERLKPHLRTEFGRLAVDRAILYRSDLHPSGAIHSPLAMWRLT